MNKNDKIVIVGASCKLPKIDSLEDLWNCLINDRSVLARSGNRYAQQYVGGFIENIDRFDPAFFNISPREAIMTDPQIRILLQEALHAIENSTLSIKDLRKLQCGVFVTALPGDYKYLLESNKDKNLSHFGFAGNSFSSISGRVSFFFDFHGPSVSMDTACSSGLYALHSAYLNLCADRCNAALVGGVTLFSTDEIFQMMNHAMIYSKNGACLPFSRRADGLVPSEACVCLVLTKKSIAAELGLPIYAEIINVMVNHDGSGSGFMAPNEKSQAQLLKEVYKDIDPNQLAYLETHGTGTVIGDKIELRSLRLGLEDKLRQNLVLGASKFTVGHALVTSGLISVVKAILSFENGIIPPVYHLKNDDIIDDMYSGFMFNNKAITINEKRPLIAINSFGFTGSNGHIVLKKPTSAVSSRKKKDVMIFPVSAKSAWSVIRTLERIKKFVEQDNDIVSLENILCCSLNTFKIRIAFIVSDAATLCSSIDDFIARNSGKEKIPNQLVDVDNLLKNNGDYVQNWIRSGDDSVFSMYKRNYNGYKYRSQYPFHEQSLWITKLSNVSSKTNPEEKYELFLSEYLSIDGQFESVQTAWLKTKRKKHHIILLPPLNGDQKMWFFQIRKFSQNDFQLHVPLYPYHGDFSKKPLKIDFVQLVDEMYRYISHIKQAEDEKINVIGWSIGGCFATQLCEKYPGTIDKLCLVSTAAKFDRDVFEGTLDIQNELNKHLELFQIVYGREGAINELLSAGASMQSLKSFYDFLAEFDITNNKNVPDTLVVHGLQDLVISREKMEKLATVFHAKKMVLPNNGHFSPLTNPKVFNSIVLSFINEDKTGRAM